MLQLLAVIITVAAVLRLYKLGAATFWLDESWSWYLANTSWKSFWTLVSSSELNMVLYYLCLRAWRYIGEEEASLRALSVVFGVVSIPALYVLGKHLFNETAGLISCGLLAFNAFHVRYSQEARSYSLLTLLLVLSTYFFVRATESPHTRKLWLLYVTFSALAVYAHAFAIFVLAAQVLSLGLTRLRHLGLTNALKWFGLLASLIAPLYIFLPAQNKGNLNWIPFPTISALLDDLYKITGSERDELIICYLLLILFALYRAAGNLARYETSDSTLGNETSAAKGEAATAARSRTWWNVRLIAAWLMFPFAAMCAISFIKPILVERYLLMCVPALALLAGYALAEIFTVKIFKARQRGASAALRLAILLLPFALSIWGLKDYYRKRAGDINEWQASSAYVLAERQTQDGILLYRPDNRFPFAYYARQGIGNETQAFVPLAVNSGLNSSAVTPEKIKSAIDDYQRIWLITYLTSESFVPKKEAYDEDLKIIRDALTRDFRLQETKKFRGNNLNTATGTLLVELYARDGD